MRFRPSAGSMFATALAFLGAGLAVLLTKGQYTWVPQNRWLAPSLFLMGSASLIGAIWLLWRFPGQHSVAPREIDQTVNRSEIYGGRSAALAAGRDIHLHYGTLTGGLSTPSGELKGPQAVTANPRPNLEYVGSKETVVFVSPHSQEGIRDPRTRDERQKSFPALVLKFENKALDDRRISRALNVIAKVRFKSGDSGRERMVDYGVWLNSPSNCTDMGIGDTRELVLICDLDDGSLITFEDKREANKYFADGFEYVHEGCVDGLEMVDITVIDQNSQAILNRKFRIWRTGVSFCVAQM